SRYAYFLAPDGMPRMLDGRGDFLPDATNQALKYLSQNEKGFFLMVEGSQIDWGGHANDSEYLTTEMLDFQKAIKVALEFAEKEGNTLVIVTADHETGGFTLSSTPTQMEGGMVGSDYDKITPTFSTSGHSATLIPVFSFGPGSEDFGGVYENTKIFDKMRKATGW
ncbi:MAG: alkaline phosphatase, partial [Cyclobacteriaceae bacterium]|nr:alkaline phosphatase [Cyclobacteriaceae bacterium]